MGIEYFAFYEFIHDPEHGMYHVVFIDTNSDFAYADKGPGWFRNGKPAEVEIRPARWAYAIGADYLEYELRNMFGEPGPKLGQRWAKYSEDYLQIKFRHHGDAIAFVLWFKSNPTTYRELAPRFRK